MSTLGHKWIMGVMVGMALGLAPVGTGLAGPDDEQEVAVFINQVLKPYTLLKKITTEVYVLDARSEEEAELEAFRQLRAKAKALDADGLIEVKRYIVKDSVAVRPETSVTDSLLRDDIDATAEPLDELTLDNYEREQGTLSKAPIEQTFDRSRLSGKLVRFTGKAIKFD